MAWSVDGSGNVVAAIADTPKVMSEGNWRLGLLIDEDASDEQTEKLAAVFSGSLGGPMGALAPLVGENPAWSARGSRSRRTDGATRSRSGTP